MLDLRWPIGFMFTLIGVLLVIYGVATGSNAEMYQHSLGKNINLWWGFLLLVFGLLMLAGAVWGGKKKNEDGK